MYQKLLRGFAVNIGNQLQNNKSIKSFNVFQNNKIFLMRDTESLFSIHQQGIQKEKMLTSEPGLRPIH